MKRDRGWPGAMWKHRTDGFTAGGEQEVKGTSGLRCAGTTMFLSLYPLLTKDLSFSLFPFQEQRVNLWSSVPQDSVYARSLYVCMKNPVTWPWAQKHPQPQAAGRTRNGELHSLFILV